MNPAAAQRWRRGLGVCAAIGCLGGAAAAPAAADAPVAVVEPLRLTVECESSGRTKACPAFLLGLVEATGVLLASPRATAEVVLYVSAVEIANADRLHLRFVGEVRGAPSTIEVDVDLDTRATDEEQLAQLKPAFVRGVALYVAVRHPGAVAIELTAPAGEVRATDTTPWGIDLALYGHGSWTGPYQSAHASTSLGLTRLEPTRRLQVSVAASGGLNRSPPVGGVSFNSTNWSLRSSAGYERHLDEAYAIEVRTSTWRGDPKGQFRFGWDGGVGLEWDRYPSDDPRGNVLAVAYSLGYQVDGYNFRNVAGERFAHYPIHSLGTTASLRQDKISYNLALEATAELLDPTRRFTLSASPGLEVQLGDHVDLSFDLSVTRRELPAFEIPDDDPEAIGRAAYAEPTSMYGSVSVRIHWDPTNGARNNRFANL